MRILLIAPYLDRKTPGESWSTFKWVEGISRRFPTTVLTQHRPGWDAAASGISAERLVNWSDPRWLPISGRLAWELKPTYPLFYLRARRWIKAALASGERFDVVHQINPLAMRYPSPARGLGLRYIVGPLAGSLPTPGAFQNRERHWYRKLRNLDGLRLRHDPWLRDTYAGAAAVLGVAPYVEEFLRPCNLRRFELMAETGVEEVQTEPKRRSAGPLRLIFVGRLIRTKGILEAIEAVARVAASVPVTLDIVGEGELMPECRAAVARHRLENKVTLQGRLPKTEVFRRYAAADAFLFPSYREPSGNVVFEAMSHGLPVIATTVGGPGYVVREDCGFRCDPTSTEFVAQLADAIRTLAASPENFLEMSRAALARMREIALWPNKLDRLAELYAELTGSRPASSNLLAVSR